MSVFKKNFTLHITNQGEFKMICRINENRTSEFSYKNDIYRKFEKQFKNMDPVKNMMDPDYVDEEMYVDYTHSTYNDQFDYFLSNLSHDIKFFVGFAGVGKTTFIRHYFNFKSYPVFHRDTTLIIPEGWNGSNVLSADYKSEINKNMTNMLLNAVEHVYMRYEDFILDEKEQVYKFISKSKNSIISSLSLQEVVEANKAGHDIIIDKLIKSQEENPISFACSILKYVLQFHNAEKLDRVLFIVDDTETLTEDKLGHIITNYFHIWDCLKNMPEYKVYVDLLISVRPYSYRYLKKNIKPAITPPQGIFWDNESFIIRKDDIPDIKSIFIKRFEVAAKMTDKPGNQITWKSAKEILVRIINGFDENIIEMITNLCHRDIRAITNCFLSILSNRVWCQEYCIDFEHPSIRPQDYKFDIVNAVRTLACGENSVYLGASSLPVDSEKHNLKKGLSFDGSDIFIPNIFVNLYDKSCDILAALVMRYLEDYFPDDRVANYNEFLTKAELINNIIQCFPQNADENKITDMVDYLFKNRIIRKSLYSIDGDDITDILQNEDYIYYTKKGRRLMMMLGSDSVLLEIYREDIRREYSNEESMLDAYTLKNSNKRNILYGDLISLVEEIYTNEDNYCYKEYIKDSVFFEGKKFFITTKLIEGIKNSLNRAALDADIKDPLVKRLEDLMQKVDLRIADIEVATKQIKIA